MNRVAGGLIKAALARQHRRLWPVLTDEARQPTHTQQRVLLDILARQRETTIGKKFGFSAIKSPADFASAVPVHDYEQLRPLILEQEQTGSRVLTSEAPTLFARTSGTTGEPKDIPVTPTGLRRLTEAQRLLATMASRRSTIFRGRILTIGSPAVEGHLPSGTPYGSASGMVIDGMPSMIRRRYLIPPEINAIADYDERYRAIALAGLSERNVTALGTANPSTLLRLRDVIVGEWPSLLDAVAKRDRRRARDLEGIDISRLEFGDLWPGLEMVITWTGGSCGLALDRLRPLLPASVQLVEVGYTASEMRGTVAFAPGRRDCVPLLGQVYFEFVARDAWEAGSADFLGLADLEVGNQYYVFITTVDGLYRYDMNDILQVVDRFYETPTLEFVQKGRGVTSITGEKLHESQLIVALRVVGAGSVPGAGFFIALADRSSNDYHLFIEGPLRRDATELRVDELARRLVDELSSRNIEYGAKRASKRLGPLVVHELSSGAGDRYRRDCLARGQRDAQFKVLHLQYRDECAVPLESLESGESS